MEQPLIVIIANNDMLLNLHSFYDCLLNLKYSNSFQKELRGLFAMSFS